MRNILINHFWSFQYLDLALLILYQM